MSLSPGHKLAHYEILEPIGKGGMGEVYRARDGKLGRDVAIKVLPDEFAKDEERLRRFRREAKVLASLNHPNIASIYGLEQSGSIHYLVLELVPGETLAERISRGPIPLEEALDIATKIAEALEEAHEQGIVHRDLKPANVKQTEDGKIKVLDYGLAKVFQEETPDADSSMSPTLTRDATRVGVILGTAAYMSPEQAKGKRVDKRADVWAFGVVLFEMLTGKRAFAGEDVSDTLAYVLTKEPEWEALPANTPDSLRQVLRLCITKDSKQRARDIGDVRLAMKGAFETTSPRQGALTQRVGSRAALGMTAAAALVLGVITGVAGWRLTRPAETPRPVARFSIPLPPGNSLTGTGRHVVALSSDGTRLVYSANEQLYLRAMDQMEATPARGTEGARSPFFSPDGEWVGFWADGLLKKVAIRGGAPVNLCEAPPPWGARWGADDTIVFGQSGTGIMQVSADGGTPEVLIALTGTAEVGHGPQVLPSEKAVLFTLGDGRNWDDAQIVVHSLETGERKVLIEGGRDARYVPTGHLVYVLDGTLLAVPVDVDDLEVTGGAIPMAEGVMTAVGALTGAAQFSVSDTGALVYVAGSDLDQGDRTLVWVDRDGREEALAAEPRAYLYPRISPDGGRLAVFLPDQEIDIWIWDFARETLTRLTFAPGWDLNPVWTPDGRQVAFASDRDGTPHLYLKAADGAGAVERLTESENDQYPYAFTPDGRQLVFLEMQNLDLVVLSLEGSPEPLLATEFSERNGEISPDGLWLAYESNASGQYEIYVRPFPNVEDGQWLISNGGGTRPLWAPDGRELFYLAPGRRLMAVPVEPVEPVETVQTEPSFAPGNAEEVFGGYYVAGGAAFGRSYDISPDGERFLMIKDETSSTEFILVQNWFEELKRLVPTDN